MRRPHRSRPGARRPWQRAPRRTRGAIGDPPRSPGAAPKGLENSLPDFLALIVGEDDVMARRRPVDAGVPFSLIGHEFSPLVRASRRDLCRSLYFSRLLYWRSERGLPVRRGLSKGASITTHPPRHMSPTRWSGLRGRWVAPAEQARSRQATPFRAVAHESRDVPLRFTTRDPWRASEKQVERYRGKSLPPHYFPSSLQHRQRPPIHVDHLPVNVARRVAGEEDAGAL